MSGQKTRTRTVTAKTSEPEADSARSQLGDQLELALKDNFSHEGSFAFGVSLPSAPNPGLEIDTLGMIGLPPSIRDVESMKGIAARSPFGHGEKLVIDSSVRDTWEIDGAKIKFRNAAWALFLEDTIKMVWKGLGVAPYTVPPKCELYKLLLYETSSHFLPHQDTEKTPGMFATIVIVLPSIYTGGEVRIVHADEEKIFDFASDSALNTTVLAWYADVVHEVKPITSGFRMALSYNLIQTGQSSVPLLPGNLSATAYLRQIFAHWSGGAFDNSPRVIFYKLEHKYSQSNLRRGVACLKGIDAHKVAQIREAAADLGINLGFGQFELHIVSEDPNDEDEYPYRWKRIRYWKDEDKEEDKDEDVDSDNYSTLFDIDIVEIEREVTVNELVDLNGCPLIPEGQIRMDGQQAELIPRDAFKKEKPDNHEWEGYQGNAPGRIDQWYKRTILLLYLKAKEIDLLLDVGGASYALSQVEKVDPKGPSEEIMKYVDYLLEVQSFDVTHDLFLVDLGLRWGDPSLWLKAANKCGFGWSPTSIGWEKVVAAWDKFGFETLRPSFEASIRSIRSLRERMCIIDLIRSQNAPSSPNSIAEWCESQTTLVLSSIARPEGDDIEPCLSIMKTKGLEFFSQSVMPQLTKYDDTYEFFVGFVKALQSRRNEFESTPSCSDAIQTIFHNSMNTAIKQWKRTKYGQYRNKAVYSLEGLDVSRVNELTECLVSTNELNLLKQFFESLIEDDKDVQVKFRDIFIPLVPNLVRIQKERNIPVDSDICKGFFHWLIETYLQKILGGMNSFVQHPSVRKLACYDPACEECAELDKFIQSQEGTRVFKYAENRRRHLESQLTRAPDLVSYKTIREGRPFKLEVKKRKEILNGSTWEGRQKAAKKFLASFGGDKALQLIMDDKFADIKKALSGEKEYGVGTGTRVVQKTSEKQPTGKGKTSQNKSRATSSQAKATKPVAGVKRKGRPGNNGMVIDLTEL